MIRWLKIDDATKRRAYTRIAEETGMSAFAAEKDWWVVQTLSVVFGLTIARHLVFKGGTSLSKAWRLIERFSEDIDLAMDRDIFGFPGELGKNQRDKLRRTAGNYVDTILLAELRSAFQARGFKEVSVALEEGQESGRDRRINVFYPNVIPSPGYLRPRIQLEIGCRSLREPCTNQRFSSLLDEHIPNHDFSIPPINIPTVNPERTFLEKIFLLHEEFHRPPEKRRVDRLSRHMYDVVKLSMTGFADKALEDQGLYETIVKHRYRYTRIGGLDYNLHQPKTIGLIPQKDKIGAWRSDYQTMREQMIYEQVPPTFEQIIAGLTDLNLRINALPWKFDHNFPLTR